MKEKMVYTVLVSLILFVLHTYTTFNVIWLISLTIFSTLFLLLTYAIALGIEKILKIKHGTELINIATMAISWILIFLVLLQFNTPNPEWLNPYKPAIIDLREESNNE